jgi:hypothetical protein
MLDIDANNKGLLIPRVALTSATDATTISSPATSLLVYNTGTGGLTPAGYYYWDGNKWVRLLVTGTPSDAWLTLGNSGTIPGTHFLGTTDNVDLVFKTNNTERMRITSAGNVGIGTTSPVGSAILDLNSTTSGFLVPRMTTAQRNAIVSPANSLIIFNTTTNCLEIYSSSTSNWQSIYCLCNPPSAPTANAATGISETGFTANWSSVAGATSYVLDVATDAAFTTFVPGYSNLNVGLVTNYNVTGLTCGTTYYYRVRAVGCASSPNSNVITVTTSACCPTSYAVTTISFSWSTISGTSAGVNCDDCVSGAIPIGFNFCFYGTTYTSVYISSNGFLTFLSGMGNGCCNGVTIPTAGGIEGFVAGCWTDLNPGAGGSVTYQTIGTAPNRIFVAQWQGVPEYGYSNSNSFQIKLYETSNRIEIHVSSIVINGHNVTIGVENQTGTLGTAAPGYNAVTAPNVTNIAWRFQ